MTTLFLIAGVFRLSNTVKRIYALVREVIAEPHWIEPHVMPLRFGQHASRIGNET